MFHLKGAKLNNFFLAYMTGHVNSSFRHEMAMYWDHPAWSRISCPEFRQVIVLTDDYLIDELRRPETNSEAGLITYRNILTM